MKARVPFPASARCVLLVTALSLLSLQGAQAQEEIKLNLHHHSDRVLFTWGCDYFQGTVMGVIVSDSGLVVIDTGLSPTTVRRQRELVEAELGRSDFRYLVNTHMHNDHAFANEVFPEATVVGPAHSVASLEREVAEIPQLLDRLRSGRESHREWAAETSPDSREGIQAREGVAAFGVGIADLERGIHPRPPTLTFEGRHSLELGDVRLELFDFAGLHSDSDILILLPDEGIVFTGDAFWGGQLPTLSFQSRDEVERLLANWKAVLDNSGGLSLALPAHSDVPLSVEQFQGMYAYVARLWEDVRTARGEGTPLVRFLLGNVFAERYPEVADTRHIIQEYNLHQHNIYVLWDLAGG